MYDCRGNVALTVRPADLEAPHVGGPTGDGGTALYLQGNVVGSAAVRFRRQSGGEAFRLVMAENMAPWLRAFSTSRWKVDGDRENFADAWRRVEEQFPVGRMLHLPQPPSVPPVRSEAPAAAVAKAVQKAATKPPPKPPPPPVWQLHQYQVRAAALQGRAGHGAAWVEGAQRLTLVKARGGGLCAWRAGNLLRPAHLHPKDLLDHLARDHGSDPAHREQAVAMINGVMPGGLAGPSAVVQVGSKALALPAGARPAGPHGESPSATSSGAHRCATVSSTGTTGAGA